METMQENIVNNIINDLELKKKNLLMQRLAELNIYLDFEKEAKRRFKSLSSVYQSNDTETIYYNDGSIDGLRVITFVSVYNFPSLSDDKSVSINTELKYY